MNIGEIFDRAGLNVCHYDVDNDEYYPMKKSEQDILFATLEESGRLTDTEKILIITGLGHATIDISSEDVVTK
jgi:hypothetical protein